MKQSATHAPVLHTSPAAQARPLGSLDHVVVDVAGVQTWQAFAGFTVPPGMSTPPMKQSATHAPLLHTSPEAQAVPLGSLDHVVVDVAGVQTWQAFAGFTVPPGMSTPPMKQSATHAPLLHTSPAAQAVPLGSLDHVVVDVAGVHTWQAFAGFTVPPGMSTPPMKQSATHAPLLHTSPAAQAVPLGSLDHVVVDVAGVHTWQAFAGFTVPPGMSVPPMKQSATHAPLLHTSPAAQAVPLGSLDHVVVDVAGVHTWQAFAGFTVPPGMSTPPMKQSATHAPLLHTSPAAQAVPLGSLDHVVVDVAGVHTWQAFAGFTVPPGMSVPPMKQSATHAPLLHTSPAAQAVPLGSLDHVVVEVDGVHTWQAFAGFTVPPGMSTPPMKQSATHAPLLHTSPAAQAVPLGSLDHVVVDVAGVHTWQAFAGFTVPPGMSVPPMKQSATHAPLLHTSPAAQAVPLGSLDHVVVEVDGVHTWQAFAGFTVPAGMSTPPMKQSATHAPLLHTSPAAQAVPLGSLDHVVVEVAGVHTWQAFAGFTVPPGMSVPPMKQSATHAPLLHTSPAAQAVPLGSLDHVVVEVAGVHTWQAFAGFTVPPGMSVPPMKQSATHAPLLHTSPAAQAVPLGSLVHVVVEVAGVQTWQAFAGFTVPPGMSTPPMKQSATHAPLLHTSPAAQARAVGLVGPGRRGGGRCADLAVVRRVDRAGGEGGAADTAGGRGGDAVVEVRRARGDVGGHVVLVGADNRRRGGRGDRVAEEVGGGAVGRRQLRLLGPDRAGLEEDVRRARGLDGAHVVLVGADDRRRAVDRDREAEQIGELPVGGGELRRLGPGGAALREHVRRAGLAVGADLVVRAADDRARAARRDGRAEPVVGRRVVGKELLLLGPGGAALAVRVGRAGLAGAAHGVVGGADDRVGAGGGDAHRDGGAVGVEGRLVARGQLLLLGPGGAALREHVGRAALGLAARRVVRGADHRDRGGAGGAHRDRGAERVAGRVVAGGQLLLLGPGGAALGEHVGGAGAGLAAHRVAGGADDRRSCRSARRSCRSRRRPPRRLRRAPAARPRWCRSGGTRTPRRPRRWRSPCGWGRRRRRASRSPRPRSRTSRWPRRRWRRR